MKICQVSKADAFGGGASRVAQELTLLLKKSGHSSTHAVSWSGLPLRDSRISLYGKNASKIRHYHSVLKRWSLPESVPFEIPFFLRRNRISEFDIFHFHDLSSAISPLTLAFLAMFKPVVWTIHDCSPFTGGCLYTGDCTNYMRGCGNCPQLGAWPIDIKVDRTRMLLRLRKIAHKSGVVCITPSEWMADKAANSNVLGYRPTVIPNGVDTSVYFPKDKAVLREKFGFPADRPVFVMSGGNLDDPRKGLAYGIRILRELADLKPFVVLLGNPSALFLESIAGVDCAAVGYVHDPALLSEYYGCADFLLFCSQDENQPLTILEAMAAGTPVAGFSVGGVGELVSNGKTGLLAPFGDIETLVRNLREAISSSSYKLWSTLARQEVVQKFSHEKLLERHLEFYRQQIGFKATNAISKGAA